MSSQFERTKKFMRFKWWPFEVNSNKENVQTEEQSKFLIKFQFNADSIELLLFDFTRIELFYMEQNKEEIMKLFNVSFLVFIWF